MSTSAHSHGETPARRRRITWRQLVVVALTAGLLFTSTACGSSPDEATVISYAAAAGRLTGLDPAEQEEQLRDWARTGLASQLELSTAQLRDAVYDTVPVRDPAFADLAEQPTGPGRALYDGHDVLHVLVPHGDDHEARTIGLLLDDHRADAGADPPQVQVHHYRIYPETQTIELTAEDPAPTEEVRSAHGYVELRVDDIGGLTDFLARTQHLSWLQVRETEIWAGGWNWPGGPGARLDLEDVSVIQRGYRQAPQGALPGFSLDPGPPETVEDILAVLPSLSPELVYRLGTDDWNGSIFPSADALTEVVAGALFHNDPQPAALPAVGLPSDRNQLWALNTLLEGGPTYSQARYDGGLAGTKVGMTLFYTDFVAKDWTSGVGSGVPADSVEGFVPDPAAVIPWSHCQGSDAPLSESGRLWFGPNESGFVADDDHVSIGARATRLFARSDGAGGGEVEPSFGFGRGLGWWDQHYQDIADYEPQYHRLDQIMRWSGALEWLVSRNGATLPSLDDGDIRADLWFQDWYAGNGDLREQSPIAFVQPPSADQEAILAKPSDTFSSCGFVYITGGVSLSDLTLRKGDRSYRAELPEPVRRAGLFDETSAVDPVTGTGRITQVSLAPDGTIAERLQRTFSTTPDGRAVVDVVGAGRGVASLGDLKIWRTETATRELTVQTSADGGRVSHRVGLQNQELGQLVATKTVDTVTIEWRSGPLDRMYQVLRSMQERWSSGVGGQAPTAADGALYSYQDAAGSTLHRIGGPDAPWLSLTKDPAPPGQELVLRLVDPNQPSGPPAVTPETGLAATLPPPPVLQLGGRAPDWIQVIPAVPDGPATIRPAEAPSGEATVIPVFTPDRKTATISQVGDQLFVRYDDPILGFNGTVEGAALLRDFPRVEAAIRSVAMTQDRLLRGVRLGDEGVALVGIDGVVLVPRTHQWAQRVQHAFDPAHPDREVLIRVENGQASHLSVDPLTVSPGTERKSLGAALDPGQEVYVHEQIRKMLTFEGGAIVWDALPRDLQVVVRVAQPTDRTSTDGTTRSPDVRLHQGAEWWRVPPAVLGDGGANGGSGANSDSGANGSAGGDGGAPANGQILLVCTEEDDSDSDTNGCEQ